MRILRFSIFLSIFLFVFGYFSACSVFAASDTLYFLHQDHLGSTRVVTNKDGHIVARYDYWPYGSTSTIEQSSHETIERLFTSQIYDSDSYLYFYNARYYNPTTGTFISADSLQGLNRYLYVSGNPINMVDPSGNQGGGTTYDPYEYEPEIGATRPMGPTTVAYTPWDPYDKGEPDPAGFYRTLGIVAGVSIAAPLAVAYGPAAASYVSWQAAELYVKGPAALGGLIERAISSLSRLDKGATETFPDVVDVVTGKVTYQEINWFKIARSYISQKNPVGSVQRLSERSLERTAAGWGGVGALVPHNAYEAVVSGTGTCVDAAKVGAEFLNAAGVPARVYNYSPGLIPHVGILIEKSQQVIMPGGKMIPLRVLEKAVQIFGAR